MCGVDIPKQQQQEKEEIIAAPTYADASVQSLAVNQRKIAAKNSKQNVKTSARGVFEPAQTQKPSLSSAPVFQNTKKTLGE